MANKKTLVHIGMNLDVLHKRLTRTVNQINELRELRKKILTGKVKQPPAPRPKRKKVMFTADPAKIDFDDPLPSFGRTPAIE